MKFVYVLVGLAAFAFLFPIFMMIWGALTPGMASAITDPLTKMFYAIWPYAAIAVIVIAVVMVLRRGHE